MVKIKSRDFLYHEIFHSRLPFYKVIEMYFDRSKPYEVKIIDFIGAQAYKVTQEVSD
jgi:hypothetical protein